jgi:hypothetical protein
MMAEEQAGAIFDQCTFAVVPSRDLDTQYALKASPTYKDDSLAT